MLRAFVLLLAALLLTACAFRLPAAPPPLPAPTPTPDPVALFGANYDAFTVTFTAVQEHLHDATLGTYQDAEWAAELARRGEAWRAAIDAIRDQPQPAGAQWAEAWPMILEAMDDCAYTATAVVNAGEQRSPFLLMPTTDRMANAWNLLAEAFRITKGD